MKSLDFLKAPFTLGVFALVMLAMAVVLLGATYLVTDAPSFEQSIIDMDTLNVLQEDVSGILAQMQLHEAFAFYYLRYGLEPDQDYPALAQADDEALTALLAELRTGDYFLYTAEDYEVQAWDEFDQLRAQHRMTFAELLTTFDGGDDELAVATIDRLQDENQALNDQLDTMMAMVNLDRQFSQDEYPFEANTIIWGLCLALIAMLLLALWGYQRIAYTTEPLNTLASAVTAIGGGQYRTSLLARLMKRNDAAGSCARKLDELAAGLAQRSAARREEIERLRQTLYESRRRRLKISRPAEERNPTP